MKKLPERVELKKRIYNLYKEKLEGIQQVEFIKTNREVSPWFIDILVPEPLYLHKYLKANGIGSRPFYPAVHTQAPYYEKEHYPHAEYFADNGLWLPSYAQLSEKEIMRVYEAIRKHFNLLNYSQ